MMARKNRPRIADRWQGIGNSAWVPIVPNWNIASGVLMVEGGASCYFRGNTAGGHRALFDEGEPDVNAGGGVVTLPATAHGLVVDGTETCLITGWPAYDGAYTILDTSTVDTIDITADFADENVPDGAQIRGQGNYDAVLTGDMEFTDVNGGEIFCYLKAVSDTINVSLIGEMP